MSVYFDLLQGVQTAIYRVPGVPPVVIRDDLFMLDRDKSPIVLISPGPGKESFRTGMKTFNKNIVHDYEVLVAYVVPGNRLMFKDLEQFLQVREDIRNQLYQVQVPNLLQAWDTNMEIGSVNKFASLIDTNYRVTGWEMKYSIAEVRAGAPST